MTGGMLNVNVVSIIIYPLSLPYPAPSILSLSLTHSLFHFTDPPSHSLLPMKKHDVSTSTNLCANRCRSVDMETEPNKQHVLQERGACRIFWRGTGV